MFLRAFSWTNVIKGECQAQSFSESPMSQGRRCFNCSTLLSITSSENAEPAKPSPDANSSLPRDSVTAICFHSNAIDRISMQIDLLEKSFKNINHDARPEIGMVISLELRWAKRLPPPVIESHWCSKEIRGRKRKLRQRNRERDQAQEEEAMSKKAGKRSGAGRQSYAKETGTENRSRKRKLCQRNQERDIAI